MDSAAMISASSMGPPQGSAYTYTRRGWFRTTTSRSSRAPSFSATRIEAAFALAILHGVDVTHHLGVPVHLRVGFEIAGAKRPQQEAFGLQGRDLHAHLIISPWAVPTPRRFSTMPPAAATRPWPLTSLAAR